MCDHVIQYMLLELYTITPDIATCAILPQREIRVMKMMNAPSFVSRDIVYYGVSRTRKETIVASKKDGKLATPECTKRKHILTSNLGTAVNIELSRDRLC